MNEDLNSLIINAATSVREDWRDIGQTDDLAPAPFETDGVIEG